MPISEYFGPEAVKKKVNKRDVIENHFNELSNDLGVEKMHNVAYAAELTPLAIFQVHLACPWTRLR